MVAERAEPVGIVGDGMHLLRVGAAARTAAPARLPVAARIGDFAKVGALASFGADSAHTVRHAAISVDKMLKDAPSCRIARRTVLVQDWFFDQQARPCVRKSSACLIVIC
jgi:hypothetical protein